jgi:recombinational DNA repair ATPase RecF
LTPASESRCRWADHHLSNSFPMLLGHCSSLHSFLQHTMALHAPKHGSWLDMAESELGVLASQCLNRRIADKKILAREVNAWQDHRNRHHAKANWQFKTADARVKLKRLYPQFE